MKSKLQYLFKRLWQSLSLVFLLSILTFYLIQKAPIDPIDARFASSSSDISLADESKIDAQKDKIRSQMGGYLPIFYFQLAPSSFPAEFHLLQSKALRPLLRKSCFQGFDGQLLLPYLQKIQILKNEPLLWADEDLHRILFQSDFYESIERHAEIWTYLATNHPARATEIEHIYQLWKSIMEQKSIAAVLLPSIHFYAENQYHYWLFGDGKKNKGVLRGDFGRSYANGKPVLQRIRKSLPLTLVLSAVSMLLSLFLGIFAGLFLAYYNHRRWSHWISSSLFLLYTIPSFWLATLLLLFFANPDILQWFPTGGYRPLRVPYASYSFWQKCQISWPFLVLPLIALTYGSFSVISRLMKSSVRDVINSQTVLASRAQGLKEKTVVFSVVLKQSLLPILTSMGTMLPALFSGSVIIEAIFSIPGMGYELLRASRTNDIPVVMAIFTISAILSTIGYFLSDVLYSFFDPRIKLEEV